MRVRPSTYQKWGEIESTSARRLVSRSSMLIQRNTATDGTKLQAKQCNYTNSSSMQQVQPKLFVDITLIVHDFSTLHYFSPVAFRIFISTAVVPRIGIFHIAFIFGSSYMH